MIRRSRKYCAEHMKEYCILRDLHPLSRMHHSGGRNCLKEIRFTRTSFQNLVLILLLCPVILTFNFARIIVNKYLSCEIIEFQYILCLFELNILITGIMLNKVFILKYFLQFLYKGQNTTPKNNQKQLGIHFPSPFWIQGFL